MENDDDLFTEPADKKPKKHISDFDTMATGLAEFYWGLRKRGVPKRYSFKLTEDFLHFLIG